jgi:hypothetical protein
MSKNLKNDLPCILAIKNLKQESLKGLVSDTWMCLKRGEGEKEIANHGRSRVKKSFSQETIAVGQRTSRNGEHEPKAKVHRKMNTQRIVQDALDSRTQLPFFFNFALSLNISSKRASVRSRALAA